MSELFRKHKVVKKNHSLDLPMPELTKMTPITTAASIYCRLDMEAAKASNRLTEQKKRTKKERKKEKEKDLVSESQKGEQLPATRWGTQRHSATNEREGKKGRKSRRWERRTSVPFFLRIRTASPLVEATHSPQVCRRERG